MGVGVGWGAYFITLWRCDKLAFSHCRRIGLGEIQSQVNPWI